MNLAEQYSKRFAELAQQALAIPSSPNRYSSANDVDKVAFQQWASSALHLVRSVFGEASPHFKNLNAHYEKYVGSDYTLQDMRGVFLGAKSDYDGGYLFSSEATIAGEIFGDFASLARAALSEGYKDVAAVLACAALEDALKRFAGLRGLQVDDKDMTEVINALKSAGLFSGPQKSLIDAIPKVRNAAMHAEWAKITAENVGSVIGFVEQFLLTKFVDAGLAQPL